MRLHAPKAAKPAPNDTRIIQALTTENANLKAKPRDLQQWHQDAMATAGGMSFATLTAVVKALHPDRAPTAAERTAAYQAFMVWKAASAKARRKV